MKKSLTSDEISRLQVEKQISNIVLDMVDPYGDRYKLFSSDKDEKKRIIQITGNLSGVIKT